MVRKKYWCDRCKVGFGYDELDHVYYPGNNIEPPENDDACPYCGGEVIEGTECPLCGEFTFEDPFCNDCQRVTRRELHTFVNRFERLYGKEFLECLDWVTEYKRLSEFADRENPI